MKGRFIYVILVLFLISVPVQGEFFEANPDNIAGTSGSSSFVFYDDLSSSFFDYIYSYYKGKVYRISVPDSSSSSRYRTEWDRIGSFQLNNAQEFIVHDGVSYISVGNTLYRCFVSDCESYETFPGPIESMKQDYYGGLETFAVSLGGGGEGGKIYSLSRDFNYNLPNGIDARAIAIDRNDAIYVAGSDSTGNDYLYKIINPTGGLELLKSGNFIQGIISDMIWIEEQDKMVAVSNEGRLYDIWKFDPLTITEKSGSLYDLGVRSVLRTRSTLNCIIDAYCPTTIFNVSTRLSTRKRRI